MWRDVTQLIVNISLYDVTLYNFIGHILLYDLILHNFILYTPVQK